MSSDAVVIVAAKRTALGAFQGVLAGAQSPDLGAAAIGACMADSGVTGDDVSELIMGCVLPAGVGQAPARQAALQAGVPLGVGCTTLNKVCGSGMKATMLGNDLIRAGSAKIVVAGGMESMTNAPYLMPKARAGYRMGHQQVLDHMFTDGLQNPYDGNMMGHFAEETAKKYGFSREDQDAFAIESVTRARTALSDGGFKNEIAPVTLQTRKGEVVVDEDEGPGNAQLEKIPTLRAAFAKRRHGHRGELFVHFRRRSSVAFDECRRSTNARSQTARDRSLAIPDLHTSPNGSRPPLFSPLRRFTKSWAGARTMWTL